MPINLLAFHYVYVVVVLHLALVPFLELSLWCHQHLQPVLLPRVYQDDDDWDTHEVYLQRPIKHGVLDYLAEEQYVVSPNKDACKDFNDGLSVLVEVGLVLGVGEESH